MGTVQHLRAGCGIFIKRNTVHFWWEVVTLCCDDEVNYSSVRLGFHLSTSAVKKKEVGEAGVGTAPHSHRHSLPCVKVQESESNRTPLEHKSPLNM